MNSPILRNQNAAQTEDDLPSLRRRSWTEGVQIQRGPYKTEFGDLRSMHQMPDGVSVHSERIRKYGETQRTGFPRRLSDRSNIGNRRSEKEKLNTSMIIIIIDIR